MLRRTVRVAAAILVLVGPACPAVAQEHVTLRSEILFYGDNTEFHNPFREGETIFGTAIRAAVDVALDERVSVSLGGFGNVRFGDEDAFERVRPVIALTITGKRSRFTFGTLSTPKAAVLPGPDRTGPHGLLPPLQRETLAFERAYEAGLAWAFTGSTLRHELWIDWQRLNTSEHRERFDAGSVGELRLSRILSVPFHLHIVHEGGQLFASGPVADSAAVAAGVALRSPLAGLQTASLELYGAASRDLPDRAEPDETRDGAGIFARAAGERAGWRGHFIVWRGFDYVKDEGDPNYLSIFRNGMRYPGTRDYAETGLTRTFRPAPGVVLEASGRLHRIEKHYEYSFRILATASMQWKLR